jgi:hypothetical protein
MGLDIIGYSRLKWQPDAEFIDGHHEPVRDDVIYVYISDEQHSSFPATAEGLATGSYSFENIYAFGAGSYSHYNAWRTRLEELSDDFDLLVNFYDNDGWIGPVAAQTLLYAFVRHRHRADALQPEYDEWIRALSFAADGGCLEFT